VIGLADRVAEWVSVVPALHVAVYDVTVVPPVDIGVVKKIVTRESPALPVTPVGALGTVVGTASLLPLGDVLSPAQATDNAAKMVSRSMRIR
jgi:hypothetical protein